MKKYLCLVLALAMSASFMVVPASANSASSSAQASDVVTLNGLDITVDPEEEIQRAIAGITDLEAAPFAVNVDISTLTADVLSSDGDYSLVSTYTTTREIQLPATYSARSDESKVYATTEVAVVYSNEKADSDKKTQDYVRAYTTLYWRDNFGPSNDFIAATGGWVREENPETGEKPVLSNRAVHLKWQNNASSEGYAHFYPTMDVFYYDESDFDYSAWSFQVRTVVTINSKTNLVLDVYTSIFS